MINIIISNNNYNYLVNVTNKKFVEYTLNTNWLNFKYDYFNYIFFSCTLSPKYLVTSRYLGKCYE